MGRQSRRKQTRRRIKSIPVNDELAAVLDQQRAAFVERFGRAPGPDDPVFFDPDADAPEGIGPAKANEMWDELCAAAEAQGIEPAIVYAMRKTGRVVTGENARFLTADELAEWDAAVAEYGEQN